MTTLLKSRGKPGVPARGAPRLCFTLLLDLGLLGPAGPCPLMAAVVAVLCAQSLALCTLPPECMHGRAEPQV